MKSQSDSQRSSGDSQAGFGGRGARNSGSKSTPQAGTSDGVVSVAAAVTISLINATSTAIIPSNVTVTSTTGTTTLRTRSNHDASSKADGKATKAGTVGIGAYPDLRTAIGAMTRVDTRIEPRPELAPLYDRLFEAYLGLYPATAPLLRPLVETIS